LRGADECRRRNFHERDNEQVVFPLQSPLRFIRSVAGATARFFITGVAVILPFAVTVFILGWVALLADAYIGPSSSFGRFLVTVFGPDPKFCYTSGYLSACVLIVLLGFLVTRATVARVRMAIDRRIAQVPLVGKIYKAVAQAAALLDRKPGEGTNRFGGVALVRLGDVRILALLTSNETYRVGADQTECRLVFIPSSPVPATGFNILVPVDRVERLDMPVEDLLKLLMSLGVLGPQILSTAQPATGRERCDS
jgi:uncharacterized membrane protein